MKHGLQVRLQQQLALTPQLQQAIRLLQMSTLELGSELRLLAEANPLLDLDDFGDDPGLGEHESTDRVGNDEAADDADDYSDVPADEPLEFDALPSEVPRHGSGELPEAASEEDLCDHLLWQAGLSSLNPREQAIAAVLIDALEEDGYLRVDNDAIRAPFPAEAAPDDAEIEAVRQRLMQFDPVGVGSRDLRECLAAQLVPLASAGPAVAVARRILDEDLDLLARNDLAALARCLDVDADCLPEAVALIHGLQPKPGHAFDAAPVDYVVPDAYAVKRNGIWQVTLNPDCQPSVRINQHYRSLIGRTSREDASYLRAQLQEARWLLKSLESRADTIARVATAIVDAQSGFLEFGAEAMRPLVLREVADAIGMHESTVSRVTTRKYLHTPRGIFEFKHFFTSGVDMDGGGSVSALAVQSLIRRLVDEEDRRKPLSDQALVDALGKQGINVARRTVTKYRKAMRIPNSTRRVQLHG